MRHATQSTTGLREMMARQAVRCALARSGDAVCYAHTCHIARQRCDTPPCRAATRLLLPPRYMLLLISPRCHAAGHCFIRLLLMPLDAAIVFASIAILSVDILPRYAIQYIEL